jgi:hypothetical protein
VTEHVIRFSSGDLPFQPSPCWPTSFTLKVRRIVWRLPIGCAGDASDSFLEGRTGICGSRGRFRLDRLPAAMITISGRDREQITLGLILTRQIELAALCDNHIASLLSSTAHNGGTSHVHMADHNDAFSR